MISQNAPSSEIKLPLLLAAYQQAIDFNMICSITNTAGDIIYVNDRFCEVSKYAREELIGQNHRIVNAGYHSRGFFEEVWATITQGNIWRGEVKSQAKDGTFFWLDSTIIPIADENGDISQYFSLRMPIDDKKELEDHRTMRLDALEEMLFQVSHQVRKPVTQILGAASLIRSTTLTNKELYDIIALMETSAQLLDKFTKELSEYLTQEKKKITPSVSEKLPDQT